MATPSEESSDTPPAKRGLDRFTLGLLAALFLAAVVTGIAWHRGRNPIRIWAKRVEAAHVREIDAAMQRCMGTATTEGVRQLSQSVRRGPLPAPFAECHRGRMAEMLVAPNAFVTSMQDTPIELYRLRERERVALQRLTGSFRLLEHAVTEAGSHPTDAQREILASKLEELAPDVDQERKAFEDLISIARDQAGWF